MMQSVTLKVSFEKHFKGETIFYIEHNFYNVRDFHEISKLKVIKEVESRL